MRHSFAAVAVASHQVFFQDPARRMAKVPVSSLKPFQMESERAEKAAWGAVLHTLPGLLNLTDGEFAARLGVGQSQLGAWFNGSENAALWRFYRDPEIHDALLLVMARRNPRAQVRLSIEMDAKVG